MRDRKPEPVPAGATTPASTRKKYARPRLTEYGDLRRIVMGVATKAGTTADGPGKPATKR